jgi:SPP1 gp7 family putative phage head morphogenesis protein
MVKPREEKLARRPERDARCIEVEKFLAKPDGQTPFQPFFRQLEEDLLAIDAPCLERRRTRGGKLFGLEIVDGSTINLIVDNTGRRPRGENDIAFQQIIRGVVWANLLNRDLIYAPRNVRSGHIYGYSPVEQIIVSINTIIRRQASQLSYFTEGNVPKGIISSPEGFTNDMIRDLQTWFDQRIGGNVAQQQNVIWTPHDSKYQPFKDAPIKDEFDEWLARIVAFAFSLPPTPFIRQMNKGTAGEDQERSLEEGLEPLKLWRKRLIDALIADDFGYPDLEFVFKVEREIDPKMQADIDDLALRNGSATIDEVRDNRGQEPLANGDGAKPRIYVTDGALTLEQADAAGELKANPPPKPEPIIADPNAPQPTEGAAQGGKNPAQQGKKKAQNLSKAKGPKLPPDDAKPLSVDRPVVGKIEEALKEKMKESLDETKTAAVTQIEAFLDQSGDDAREALSGALQLIDVIDLSNILNMHEPLLEGLEEIITDIVPRALASVGVDAESELVDQVSEAALEYARARAAELVSVDGPESLVVSTRGMIRDVIADGLENNVGKDQIVADLRDATAFSEFRAELIASTEISMANAAGKKAAWDQIKEDGATLLKQWFASGEEGVCDECEGNEADGEIAYDDAFSSGDEMEPAHPACRCVVTARVVTEDDAGGSEGDEE